MEKKTTIESTREKEEQEQKKNFNEESRDKTHGEKRRKEEENIEGSKGAEPGNSMVEAEEEDTREGSITDNSMTKEDSELNSNVTAVQIPEDPSLETKPKISDLGATEAQNEVKAKEGEMTRIPETQEEFVSNGASTEKGDEIALQTSGTKDVRQNISMRKLFRKR